MQYRFKPLENEFKKDFGGSLLRGNPREKRPISIKRPMHVVMRSSMARGQLSFLNQKRRKRIESLVRRTAASKGVKLYRYANSGNHLHIIILPSSREAFNSFVRVISGLIARLTLGAEKGSAKGLKFWDARPFTRVIEWGRDYNRACAYVLQNTLEALGFAPYRKRESRRKKEPPS